MHTEIDFVIDDDLETFLEKSPAEIKLLTASIILDQGCRDPFVVWSNPPSKTPILIDGHCRYRICEDHGLRWPAPKMMEFESREHVLDWMVRNQLGRRNFTDSQRAMIGAKLADEIRKCKTKDGRSGVPMGTSGAANKVGVTERQVERARVIIRKATPALADAVTHGEVSVRAAADVAKLPKPQQVKIVQKGPEAVKAAAKAIREHREPEMNELPDSSPFDTALSALKQVMGAIHALCGDGNGRRPSKAGHFIAKQRQELEGHVDELRRAFRFAKPYGQCPYCLGKDGKCDGCNGVGWVGEDVFKRAPSEMRARVKL